MDFEQLIFDLQAVLAHMEESEKADANTLRHVQRPLAYVFSQAGRTAEGLKIMKDVAYLSLKTDGANHSSTRHDFLAAFQFAKQLNDLVEALNIYEELALLPEPSDLSLVEQVSFKCEGAYLYERLNQLDEAEEHALAALDLANSTTDCQMQAPRLKAIHILANVVRAKRKFDDACEFRRQELVMMEETVGADHPGLLPIIEQLIEHLATARRMDEVAELAKRRRFLKWRV